jgi:hypothetical protein
LIRNPLGKRSDANRKKNITVNLKGEGCDDKMCMQLAQDRVLRRILISASLNLLVIFPTKGEMGRRKSNSVINKLFGSESFLSI